MLIHVFHCWSYPLLGSPHGDYFLVMKGHFTLVPLSLHICSHMTNINKFFLRNHVLNFSRGNNKQAGAKSLTQLLIYIAVAGLSMTSHVENDCVIIKQHNSNNNNITNVYNPNQV